MEFNEKLQELRKSRSLTQEELAKALFVSRTAIAVIQALIRLRKYRGSFPCRLMI